MYVEEALEAVDDHGPGTTSADVAEYWGCSVAAASDALLRARNRGLLKRRRAWDGTSRWEYKLTAAGRAALTEWQEDTNGWDEDEEEEE